VVLGHCNSKFPPPTFPQSRFKHRPPKYEVLLFIVRERPTDSGLYRNFRSLNMHLLSYKFKITRGKLTTSVVVARVIHTAASWVTRYTALPLCTVLYTLVCWFYDGLTVDCVDCSVELGNATRRRIRSKFSASSVDTEDH